MGWCRAESRSAVSDRYDALSEAAELADLRDRDLELDESRAAVEVAAEEPPAESEAVTGASAESAADFLTADALAAQPEESPKEFEAAKKKAAVEAAANVTADSPAAEESQAATEVKSARSASARLVRGSLVARVAGLQQEVAQLEEEKTATLKKLRSVTAAERSATSRSSQLKAENDLLRKRHGDETSTVFQLEAQVKSFKSQVAALKKEAARVKEHNDLLQNEIDQAKKEVEQLKARCDEATAKRDAYELKYLRSIEGAPPSLPRSRIAPSNPHPPHGTLQATPKHRAMEALRGRRWNIQQAAPR